MNLMVRSSMVEHYLDTVETKVRFFPDQPILERSSNELDDLGSISAAAIDREWVRILPLSILFLGQMGE